MILFEAGLSFLGLGIQPPTPSWGSIMSAGRQYVARAWWLTVFPGACLFVLVLCVNLFGRLAARPASIRDRDADEGTTWNSRGKRVRGHRRRRHLSAAGSRAAFARGGRELCLSDIAPRALEAVRRRGSALDPQRDTAARHRTDRRAPRSTNSRRLVAKRLGRARHRRQQCRRLSAHRRAARPATRPSGTASWASICARRSWSRAAMARLMIAAGTQGAIVNIGSGAARQMRDRLGPLLHVEDGAGAAVQGPGAGTGAARIRVNVVEPGFAPGSDVEPAAADYVERDDGRASRSAAPAARTTRRARCCICARRRRRTSPARCSASMAATRSAPTSRRARKT